MYRHFATKEDLGRTVYRRALNPILADIQSALQHNTTTAQQLIAILNILYNSYDHRPKALALLCFPPHEFIPEELSLDHPHSLRRVLLLHLCHQDADRASLIQGALLGPLTDRYLKQRNGSPAEMIERLARPRSSHYCLRRKFDETNITYFSCITFYIDLSWLINARS